MSLQPTDLNPLDSPAPRDAIVDRRVPPRGLLPRHLQTWVMLGLAAAMLFIIVVTGRPAPPTRRAPDATAPASSAALPPDRLRRYQEQLAEQETRLRQEIAATQAAVAAAEGNGPQPQLEAPPTVDPLADEQRRRAYSSLFAENVAFTRRTDGGGSRLQAEGPQNDQPGGFRLPPSGNASADHRSLGEGGQAEDPPPAPSTPTEPQQPAKEPLLEGTIVEAVLTNRLDGSMAGPLNALVTSPVYTDDRVNILIPSGARVLGTAAPVQALGESRLAVRFHRLIMPNGQSYSLNQFTGLNQRGDAGLKDQVNRHYLQLFGASLAIGSLSGLAQYSTRSGASGTYSFSDAYGQGLGGSLAASAGRILDRFLNLLPTVTIREGHRIKIYLTSDLVLPPYREETHR